MVAGSYEPGAPSHRDVRLLEVFPLTVGLILGAALRDVGAEHGADPRVRGEAPGELLAVWVPAVVLSQVSGKQTKSRAAVGRSGVLGLPRRPDSLAGVSLGCEGVVVGVLRVPALTRQSCRCCVYGPSVAPSFALVALCRLHHVTFRGVLCGRVAIHLRRAKITNSRFTD